MRPTSSAVLPIRHLGTVLLGVTGSLVGEKTQAVQLPVPCTATSCTSNVGGTKTTINGFVTSGSATATQSGNQLTVNQTSTNAILNWSSFNIGAGGAVVFQQPSSSSIALNQIYQDSPSSIFGKLSANGQVYLINPNGFLFGSTASVNVAGLLASSLNMSTSTFTNGILSPLQSSLPALQSDGRTYVTDSNNNLVLDSNGNPEPVEILVEQGAQITAASGGRILLAGQQVSNAGTLTAPTGQIALAAGQSVYLEASTDATLRGLVVEVTGSGTVSNEAAGTLSTPDGGNVSLVGLAVNQSGRISATSTVSANGSVRLEAASGATINTSGTSNTVAATEGGTLTLASTSDIEVTPDLTSTETAVADQTVEPATINLTGQAIYMHGGKIIAPDGQLNVTAAANPSVGVATDGNTSAQIRIDSGTDIDLSGSDVTLPMSANLLTIELLANELADDPDQRNGFLHGQTVTVDMRDGDPALINSAAWTAALDTVTETIAQETSHGGSAHFLSEGDIVLNSGASVNVSGGTWNYQSGNIFTTKLIGANGKTYDISTASPLMTYVGIVNSTYTTTDSNYGVKTTSPTVGASTYESGYVEGQSAGTVQFASSSMVLNGTLTGKAVNGPYQRSGSSVAQGGTLEIGLGSSPINSDDYLAPSVTFTEEGPAVSIADGSSLLPQTLQLPVQYLTSGGFTQTEIYSDSTVTLPQNLALTLLPDSTFSISAPRIDIDSSITALGGTIDLQSILAAGTTVSAPQRYGVDIGDGVTLDVSGQWTNDAYGGNGTGATSTPSGLTAQNAGSIDLGLNYQGGELVLGDEVSLLANGGAWVSASGSVTNGAGGSITIDAQPALSALQVGSDVSLAAFGVGTAKGGSFSLTAPRIAVIAGGSTWATAQQVDDLDTPTSTFDIAAALFSKYGFTNISLTASGPIADATSNGTVDPDVLTVTSGTTINAIAQSLQLGSSYLSQASGGTVSPFTTITTLPESSRHAVTISLAAAPATASSGPLTSADTAYGNVDIQAGSSITVDAGTAGGAINVSSQGSITIDGTLRAQGGTVSAEIKAPTNADEDPGYVATQQLLLGSSGLIDVSGLTVLTPNTLGLKLGTVLAGGTVDLWADRGDVVTEAGSLINFSGTSSKLDVLNSSTSAKSGYRTLVIGSAGGSMSVRSPEAISLLGSLSGAAGANATGTLESGSLEIDLTRSVGSWFEPEETTGSQAYSTNPLTIELVSSTAGSSPTASYGDLAVLGVTQLQQSGIDSLTLKADGDILLASSTPLRLGREISLDTPVIEVSPGITASLSAPYVTLGYDLTTTTTVPTAIAGTGKLNISADDEIDLYGPLALQGVASTTLSSDGDVQFEPDTTTSGANMAGVLSTAGDLTIDAERIYPSTNENYTISAGGTVTIGENGISPGAPESVAGSLTIDATNIISNGSIYAPFGSIDLNATSQLTLGAGSLTSVSAYGLTLPYGQTQLDAAQWIYTEGNLTEQVTTLPDRTVQLTAPNITVANGATVDLRGGGDLQAYEWVPGTNGNVDALASGGGYYAILPANRGQSAAYDYQEFAGSGITTGETVYLTGITGLPAGYYAVLPARYALLPGAYLIQVESNYQSLTGGKIGSLTDGTPVVAGYFSVGTTGLRSSAEYEGFAVWKAGPGTSGSYSYAQQLAEYTITDASMYFTAAEAQAGIAENLPADAGDLVINVQDSFSAQGQVLSAAATGGTAATIEISAPNLEITSSSSAASSSSTVAVSASTLSGWTPGLLLLGGETDSSGNVHVDADSVTIDSGAVLTAGTVLAVANNSLNVQSGATVESNSGVTGASAPSTTPTTTSVTLLQSGSSEVSDSGAALLAVSDSLLPVAGRSGTASSAATIDVEGTLSSQGAISLDSPGEVTIGGTINGTGAQWSLASQSIAFVGAGQSSSDTLLINPTLLADLQQAGSVRLSAENSIDLLTSVSLGVGSSGTPTLTGLTLVGSSINNDTTGTSTFGAKTLTLTGNSGSSPTPTTGSGTIAFVGNQIDLGSGNLAISGDASTSLQSSGAIAGQASGVLTVAGDLSLQATELTALSGSSTSIEAPSGSLSITQQGTPDSASSLTADLGGNVALSAQTINDTGAIIVPAGQISLQATQGITLGASAQLNTAGITVTEGTQTVGAAGGSVTLDAGGDVSLVSTSSINVSGAGDAPAGSLSITSGGTATLAGTLTGSAATGALGGSFTLDANALTGGLTPLISSLTQGGFSNSVSVDVHTGDLVSAAGSTLSATSISLTADTGTVEIAGTLSATSGAERGSIDLFGGTAVVLDSTALLQANGSSTNGNAGNIELSTETGQITLDSGSVITASGSSSMGSLLLRAPEINGNDVAISTIGSDVSQVGQVIIEPVLSCAVLDAAACTTTPDFGAIETDVTNYMSGAQSQITSRLALPNGQSLTILPGVELDVQGDLTLSQAVDLSTWQQPVDLTVRASGNLNIDANFSDGVDSSNALLSTMSSTLRFVGGADLTSANPLAVNAANTTDGDLTLGAGVIVRTGTGDIDLAASQDIVWGSGATVYTVGTPGSAALTGRAANSLPFVFPTDGGSINISAGGNIVGAALTQNASISDWQPRSESGSGTSAVGQWGVNLSNFSWNTGTLGGGDLTVKAGANITNFSAATADTYVANANGTGVAGHYGGGSMSVTAGGNIDTGEFYVAQGTGTLRAGGAFGSSQSYTSGTTTVPVYSLIATENAAISLWAQDSIELDAIVNPTVLYQQYVSGAKTKQAEFFSYGADSSLSLQSVAGDVTINNNSSNQEVLIGQTVIEDTDNATQPVGIAVAPTNLTLESLSKDVVLSGSGTMTLYPSSNGELKIFAGGNIVGDGLALMMSDALAADIPTAASPNSGAYVNVKSFDSGIYDGLLHSSDTTPVMVSAGGDITNLTLSVPKASEIEAGGNITDLSYSGENLNSTDVTLIYAGGSFSDDLTTADGIVQVGGPGNLEVIAGDNVNLGLSIGGITTVGNLINPNLSSTGANVTVVAGLGGNPSSTLQTDYSNFLTTIIEPSTTYQTELVKYVESLTGQSGLSVQQAETEFAALDTNQQAPFIDQVFFNELNLSGIAETTKGAGFTEGYAAIDALFPKSRSSSNPYSGNLTLDFSQIYTLSGGDISLLVPGGAINVGLANSPSGLSGTTRAASKLGIVAQGTGDINIYTEGDVNVNSSRIFTLGGGNILVWSDEGNIDAGRGAKTSLSAPAPTITINSQGQITVNYQGAIAGSGIRTIQTSDSVAAGNVDLIAPEGTVNAGDAGIGAAGNINIAAVTVLGASNISAGGSETGVPQLPNLSASLSSATAAASGASSSASDSVGGDSSNSQNSAPLAQAAISWLQVFVTGLGEDNCKPDDNECLKRQSRE